ncbi:hypothetical protein F2P79_022855 [Pimephales promelas]|nr:hypothetical protein F2P79_022855 [Pimephales promelas]
MSRITGEKSSTSPGRIITSSFQQLRHSGSGGNLSIMVIVFWPMATAVCHGQPVALPHGLYSRSTERAEDNGRYREALATGSKAQQESSGSHHSTSMKPRRLRPGVFLEKPPPALTCGRRFYRRVLLMIVRELCSVAEMRKWIMRNRIIQGAAAEVCVGELKATETVKHEITGSSADPAVCDGHQKPESAVQARLRDVWLTLWSRWPIWCVYGSSPLPLSGLIWISGVCVCVCVCDSGRSETSHGNILKLSPQGK